eukprot:snap_masked-scaffold_38-processed-gene-1.32-mRNA-1 protein AED:1.00 eAED:1.00 QI:0/0/0/0/1/1/2/0/486
MPTRKHRASYLTRALYDYMGAKKQVPVKGAWIVDHNPGLEELKKVLSERLLKIGRFKSVFQSTSFGGHFREVSDEDIDWKYHLSIPAEFEESTASEQILFSFSEGLFAEESTAFTVEKPLWRMFLIPKIDRNGETKAALVSVTNHALGDGVSTVGVLLKIVDNPPFDPSLPIKDVLNKGNNGLQKRKKKPQVSFLDRTLVKFTGVWSALTVAFGGYDSKSTLTKADDTKIGRKLIGRSKTSSLVEMKKMKNLFAAYEVSVNDVVLTILSMAMRSYFESTGEYKKNFTARGNFPVSLRSPKDPLLKNGNPSNRFMPFAFRFIMDYQDPFDCLFKVKKQLDLAKISPQLPLMYKMTGVAYKIIPKSITSKLLLRMNSKATSMLSNVAGPSEALRIANVEVEDLMFALNSPVLLYFGILTYCEKVNLSLTIDERLGVEPKKLLERWDEQLEVFSKECCIYKKYASEGGKIPKQFGDRQKVKKKLLEEMA